VKAKCSISAIDYRSR